MTAHGYDTKRFPLTASQGRVLYHLERLFRSTGHGIMAHAQYIAAVREVGLDPERVADWTVPQCVQALQIMERVARAAPGFRFRPCDTGWRDFAGIGVGMLPVPELVEL